MNFYSLSVNSSSFDNKDVKRPCNYCCKDNIVLYLGTFDTNC